MHSAHSAEEYPRTELQFYMLLIYTHLHVLCPTESMKRDHFTVGINKEQCVMHEQGVRAHGQE